MPDIAIVKAQELKKVVRLEKPLIEMMKDVFSKLSSGAVTMPPILNLPIHEFNGEVDVKTAYIKGLDNFAIKISPGFFDNPKQGLPSLNGLMALFCVRTGLLKAMLLDNGYLTEVRTAAAGALSCQVLANEIIDEVGVIGAGSQAELQIEALKLVRDFSKLNIWARKTEKAQAYAEKISTKLQLETKIHSEIPALMEVSDIIITATPSGTPLIKADWLRPGMHITAMGSDADYKNEIDPGVFSAGIKFYCDRKSQSEALGELRAAISQGAIPPSFNITELGEVILDASKGRTSKDDITLCDLTGTGAQDTAVADFAFKKASEASACQIINNPY